MKWHPLNIPDGLLVMFADDLKPLSKNILHSMKRYLRFLLIVLFSFALPVIGMAGMQASAEPCRMDTAEMTMMDGMGPDCCQDSKSPSEHNKSCKPGKECKTGSLLQVSVIKTPIAWSHPIGISYSSDSLPLPTPSGVWRPPRV